MRTQRPRRPIAGRAGFSLTELLVVLAIGAMVVGTAVATFLKFASLPGREVERASRELYSVLRAAKVYAATFRVNTALAYGIEGTFMEGGQPQILYLRSYSLARAMDSDLANRVNSLLNLQGDPYYDRSGADTDDMFFLVSQTGGAFKKFPGDACVHESTFYNAAQGTFFDDEGFCQIELFSDEGELREILNQLDNGEILPDDAAAAIAEELIEPLNPKRFSNMTDEPLFYFPAHCFTPSGIVECGPGLERFQLLVGLTPEAQESLDLPPLNPLDPGEPSRTIELFRSTGRVKIARED